MFIKINDRMILNTAHISEIRLIFDEYDKGGFWYAQFKVGNDWHNMSLDRDAGKAQDKFHRILMHLGGKLLCTLRSLA